MDIGMLWHEPDHTKPLETCVREAAAYYRKKYGHPAELCYIHPVTGPECQVDDIQVLHSGDQLPYHYWLGVHSQPVSTVDWKTRRRDDWRMEMDREERTP